MSLPVWGLGPGIIFPCLRMDGYSFSHANPMLRVDSGADGRSSQRRGMTCVPSMFPVVIIITGVVMMDNWNAWMIGTLGDISKRFLAEIRTPLGLQTLPVRIASEISGPDVVGVNVWRIAFSLELFERPIDRGLAL